MNAVLEALRAEIQARAPFIGPEPGAPSGIASLDDLTAGLPTGAVTVLSGPRGTGRTRLAARVLAAQARAGAPVAWIDGTETLYPPALAAEGLELERLLMVRKADPKAVHAFEQILESGLFAAAVGTGLDRWLAPPSLRRIQRAAEAGRRLALLISSPATAKAFDGAALRLGFQGHAPGGRIRIEVEKDRRGKMLGRAGFLSF